MRHHLKNVVSMSAFFLMFRTDRAICVGRLLYNQSKLKCVALLYLQEMLIAEFKFCTMAGSIEHMFFLAVLCVILKLAIFAFA